jgi:hypothetical protein
LGPGLATLQQERFAMELQELLSGLHGGDALNQAAGQAGLEPGLAHQAMQGVIEHMNSGGAAEEVVSVVAAKCGVSPDQVQAFLPQILPLLQAHAEGTSGEAQGMMGGLIARLGGFLH